MSNGVMRGQAVRGLAVTLAVLMLLAVAVRWGTVVVEQSVAGSTVGASASSLGRASGVLTALKSLLIVRIIATLVSVVVAVAALVVAGMWVARAHTNATDAAPGSQRVPRALAVVASVIPVIGVFLLPFVYDDLGRAAGIRRRVLPLVVVWWVTVVAGLVVFFAVQVDVDPRRNDFLAPVVRGDMLLAGLTTLAAVALAAAVLAVSARQEAWRRGSVPPAEAVTQR